MVHTPKRRARTSPWGRFCERPDQVQGRISATALEIEQVNKWYAADVHAVRDVNLAVEPGEFMIFVGPSGCGKSTLLRMVAGLERVDSGVIRMDGKSIHLSTPDAERKRTMTAWM